MSNELLFGLYIFVLAGFLGHYVIEKVPPLLHTPLMAGTNAISGISLVGSLVAAAGGGYGNAQHGARLHRRHLRHHQHGRRLPDHRPHAADVQEEGARDRGQRRMSASLLAVPHRLGLLHPGAAGAVVSQPCPAGQPHRRLRHAGRRGGDADLHRHPRPSRWIAVGLILGSVIGAAMSIWIPMTKMPERIALSHCFGGLAAALVGVVGVPPPHGDRRDRPLHHGGPGA